MALTKISVITKEKLQRYHNGLKNLFVAKETGKGLSTNDYTTAEKEKLAGIAEGANKTIVENVLTSTSETNALSAAQGKVLNDKIAAINTNMEDLGAGDMLKSTYDVNGDGVVDDAEKLGGQLPAYYAKASDLEAAQGAIDAIEADYLKAADKSALQTNIDGVSGRVTANENAIATLNGTGAGSVSKAIDDAFNEFSTRVSDDAVVNTYKELIDYAAEHGSEFTELVGEVDANASAIEALQADHYNSTNMVEVTDSEIDDILAS